MAPRFRETLISGSVVALSVGKGPKVNKAKPVVRFPISANGWLDGWMEGDVETKVCSVLFGEE